jgi:glycosyltransferase involved in cell wall biosynthesis
MVRGRMETDPQHDIDTGRGEVWWPGTMEPTIAAADVGVIIPALNEERSIGLVLDALPGFIDRVVVVDNGSDDATAEVAKRHGAIVVSEPRKGYGSACLTGIDTLAEDPPDIVTFLDGDFSDDPSEIDRLLAPILAGDAELVIGSRAVGARQDGALLPQARFGNRLACVLIEQLHGYRFTDLGPFRAITWDALQRLEMSDPDYGWTVEMQLKAARLGIASVEVPVSYTRRIGVSKVTGTVTGTVMAGYKILWTILREYWSSD